MRSLSVGPIESANPSDGVQGSLLRRQAIRLSLDSLWPCRN